MPSQETHRQPGFATGFSLLIPITLSTMAIVLLAPILPRLLAEYSHVPNFEYWVPMVITVPALCVALFSPIAGMLGDYYGRRRLLIASFVGYGITGIAPVFLTDLNMILLSRIGVGIMEALIMVLTTTMLGDYFKGERRDRWLAAQTATASISALVFFNLGGQLGAFGWRTPFWIYLSALGMMVLVILFTWEPKGGDPTAEADQAPHNASWKTFPWARFLPVLLVTIYSSVFFYTVQIQAGVGLSELGLSNPAEIGFLTSIASLGVPLGTFLYSRIGGRRPVLLLAVELFTLSIGFMMMALAKGSTLFLVGCFINQLGAGMLLPTLLVWAISQLAFEVRGRGAGLWQSAFALGQFICPLVVTFFAKSLSGLFPAFAALSVSAVFGAVVAVLFLMRPKKVALS